MKTIRYLTRPMIELYIKSASLAGAMAGAALVIGHDLSTRPPSLSLPRTIAAAMAGAIALPSIIGAAYIILHT